MPSIMTLIPNKHRIEILCLILRVYISYSIDTNIKYLFILASIVINRLQIAFWSFAGYKKILKEEWESPKFKDLSYLAFSKFDSLQQRIYIIYLIQ